MNRRFFELLRLSHVVWVYEPTMPRGSPHDLLYYKILMRLAEGRIKRLRRGPAQWLPCDLN